MPPKIEISIQIFFFYRAFMKVKNFNEVTLIGELISNTKMYFVADELVLYFALETGERRYNPDSKKKIPATELHGVMVYGELISRLSQELSRGQQVYVRGEQKHEGADIQATEVRVVSNGTAFATGSLVSKRKLKMNSVEVHEAEKVTMAEQSISTQYLLVQESPRVAVICTGHINNADALIMPELCWNSQKERGRHWIQCMTNGWLLRISDCCEWEQELIQNGISYFAIHNLNTLNRAGYNWIYFDADAPMVKGLVYWIW